MKERDLSGIQKTKKELLLKLLEITKRMKSLIVDEKIDELNDRLQDRQEIILLIDTLDQQMLEMAPDNRQSVDLMIEMQNVLKEIQKLDTDNHSLAQEILKDYRGQIRTLNQTKKGMDIYVSPFNKNDGIFIDAKK